MPDTARLLGVSQPFRANQNVQGGTRYLRYLLDTFDNDLTLTSITSWDEGELLNPEDADGSPLIVVRPSYFGEAEQFAQDLRVTSDTGTRFDFIAGVCSPSSCW